MGKIEKTNDNIKLVLESPEGKPATRSYAYEIESFIRFGKEIKVSPKSHAMLHPKKYKLEFSVDTVSVCIGIGYEETADLVMSKRAWEALQKGAKVSTVTTEEFKKKYVYKRNSYV